MNGERGTLEMRRLLLRWRVADLSAQCLAGNQRGDERDPRRRCRCGVPPAETALDCRGCSFTPRRRWRCASSRAPARPSRNPRDLLQPASAIKRRRAVANVRHQLQQGHQRPATLTAATGVECRRAQTPLTRRSARMPAPAPASPGSRRASARSPSRQAASRVRRLRALGNPGCRRRPADRVSRQNVPSRIRRASSPRSRGRRLAASSWSRCTSTVRRMFSTRSALRPACRAPKRTAATAAAAASHPRSASALRSSQPWRSSHISAGPCDDHRCEPTA